MPYICEHCNEKCSELVYSELYNKNMCRECFARTAELYIETGDIES